LEFHSVIIPFCLNNKNWPARPIPEKIRMPSDLFKTRAHIRDKEAQKTLALQDETRLFYVAMTRAKSNLIFTASPTEDLVSSLYLTRLDIPKEGPKISDEEKILEESLEVTDKKDPFVGTDAVLKDMVNNMSLNPTRLNAYITCKRKFLYNDLLKLPGAKKKSLVFGNCVHKALEETYREFMAAKKFPSFKFFLDAFKKELKFQGVDKTDERDCLKKAEAVRGWFETAAKNPVMPVGLERKLVITVGDNIIFTGKYDKVEFEDEKNGIVRILDYKTGKPDEHLKKIDKITDLSSSDCDGYLRQLVCYRLLFEKDRKESRGMRAHSGALVFIEPVESDLRKLGYEKGRHVTKRVEITDPMVQEVEELIKKVWGQVKALDFGKLPCRDAKVCGMCDFDPICWK
ncbi:MAG: PD-(D/E)XK nuclease family protein, partial [Candidatus Omnitrophica bacterium]|nr:PD-(D/E)XK nuclease family protein [Candidatus Omnitrophota bacterium]